MSNYVGNRVSWLNKHGRMLSGIVLKFQSDSVLVGVQSVLRPYVRVCGKMVPNNSLWAVPFDAIVNSASEQKAA